MLKNAKTICNGGRVQTLKCHKLLTLEQPQIAITLHLNFNIFLENPRFSCRAVISLNISLYLPKKEAGFVPDN